MRGIWVYDDQTGGLVPKDDYLARRAPVKRSALPTPFIQTDAIEAKSMLDGRVYTSKAALRRSYRERGAIEVGTDPLPPRPRPKPDREGIRQSIRKAKALAGLS